MEDLDWSQFKPVNDDGVGNLIAAITHVESGGDTDATSPQGARGSMQIMPATFKQYALAGESYANDDDRRAAASRKIADDYNHYGGDMAKTAAAYIGGRGAVRADGTIRDDVADSLGTTPAAYADRVLARAGQPQDLDWSQFKPVETDWSQFVPMEQTQSRAGQGRGMVNPPLVGQTQTDSDAKNAAIDKKVAELQAINPGVSADRLRGMAMQQMDAVPSSPVNRVKQYTAKGYTPVDAQANAAFDERTETRLNKTAITAEPDERGNRAIQSYNPNTEADKTAALAAQYRAAAPYANESQSDMRVRKWNEANPLQSAFADNYKTVAVNALGGMAKLGTSAVAAGSAVVGARDTADYFDDISKNISGTMQENAGDTVTGKTASIIGAVAPMLALPAVELLHVVATAGLFGVPAFRDTLNAKLEQGMDFSGALTHAVAAFAVNMALPSFATKGTSVLGRALGVAEKDAMGNAVVTAMGARGAATQLGLAAAEGAGFATGAALIDHSIDYALKNTGHEMGEQQHSDLLDPKELFANALAFVALRGRVASEHYTGEAGVKQAAAERDFHINQMAQEIAGHGSTFDESRLWGLANQIPVNHEEQKQPISQIEHAQEATNTVAGDQVQAPKAEPIQPVINPTVDLTSIRPFRRTTAEDISAAPTFDVAIAAANHSVPDLYPNGTLDGVPTGALNEQNTASRTNTETKAAPVEAPAHAGVDASGQSAARSEAGSGVLEATGVEPTEQRLVPVSKRDSPITESHSGVVDAAMLTGNKLDSEWRAFADDSGTLSIPRSDMPQIKAEHRGAMVNFLNARDIAHRQEEVEPNTLKPTQTEFSPAKVEKALGFDGTDRSILVSSDNHVLDGHHQWMAKLEAGEPVKVIRLDAPIKKLLDVVREFPSAEAAHGAVADNAESVAEKPGSVTEKASSETQTGTTVSRPHSDQPGLEKDDGENIPPRYFKKVKVDHTVWIEDEGKSDTMKVSAKDALRSLEEDRENYEKLLNCMEA